MTTLTHSTYVHGAAVTVSWQDSSKSLMDLIFAGVTAALADAHVDMADVDSVVLAAHDLVDGRSLSSMVTAPAAGAYLRDEIRLSEDGLAALSLGVARIAAGESRLTIVAAWGRASEGTFMNTSRAAMDPFLVQPFGLTELDISALRLSRWLGEYTGREHQREAAINARRQRANANPRALQQATISHPANFPLKAEEGPKWADVVAAVVIGEEESPYRITGVGHSTEMTAIGDRDLLAMPALLEAASAALGEAGISLDKIDLFEIDGMTLPDEALALEALNLCAPGEGFAHYALSSSINPSGGSEAGWCYPAMGLVRFTECYLRVRDGAGGQKHAMAIGTGPVGAQTRTAVVLGAE